MIGKSVNQDQRNLFLVNLSEFIDPSHPLCLLAEKIDWEFFEKEFSGLYLERGAPAKPIRLMIGLLILKQVYNLGDETVMAEWISNPYYQCRRPFAEKLFFDGSFRVIQRTWYIFVIG